MIQSKHSATYIGLALLMSSAFSILFAVGLMARTNSGDVTVIQFFSNLDNLMFCLNMFSLVLATWLMRGSNNRAIVLCWCIGLAINYSVYWLSEHYFLFENRNVYAMSFINTASALPLIVLCRYRMTLSIFFLRRLNEFAILKGEFNHYLNHLKVTDFEVNVLRALSLALCLEFLYSIYLFNYALLNGVPHDGSIYQKILENGDWDPFYFYNNSVQFVTAILITLFVFHLYRETKQPDEFMNTVSDARKRQVIAQMLEERRKKK